MRRGLRFIVLIREAFESLSFGGVITGQHFLLSYFKTLSDGPAGVELTTSHMVSRCSTN